ncbi:NADH-quinone oxidoreductase subunit M [Thermanaerothrix sp. 4228-RoL]|uniref:NADH-quinone oxidoreductase subunit M n=1 Tax=Thermanaerothrix solaris TaxID=3058434 RepID=A0ABU3NR63_9CHLR|nr:NADH-quinone oxidoreductase subunit M [Thermanaerothrix sp. 4228-RoL]MDT8898698.1 NADH-quinone oxidoreductase subunit M [Thermanaerothrix sp. 4228-RoL]
MILGINGLIGLIALPLVGFVILLFIPSEAKKALRWVALLTSLATFVVALGVLAQFQVGNPNLQMVVRQPWVRIGDVTIEFYLGVDGLSLLMVLLTAFLTPIAILSTWSAVEERVKGFMLFFLLLESGMLGVFLALDLVLFYIFWEFTLVPMIFLIGVWGGERRVYAAVKFFLFTMVGSVLMLLGILYLGLQTRTFAWDALLQQRGVFAAAQLWLFLAFGLAFAIKVPMFPLHTWLPDAHVEAPTAGSVILAGVLLKMGAYGFLRFNLPLFPQATLQLAPWMAGLAVVGILYGAAVAYAQQDVKKLVAYSSVSHLGFVMLGTFALTAQGLAGAVLQMVNHGLSTGALFLIVGMLYERRHTRQMSAFGGIWKIMPVLGALSLVVTLSSLGLPGLNGFVGELTILLGAFRSTVLGSPWFAGVATVGVILAAVYLLTMFEKVFLGPVRHEENRTLPDLNAREVLTLVPILVLIFWIGLYPQPFLNLINPSAEQLVALVQSVALAAH